MGLISLSNTFSQGESVVASKFNQNFNDIVNTINGNITDVNCSNLTNSALSGTAAIVPTKVATAGTGDPTLLALLKGYLGGGIVYYSSATAVGISPIRCIDSTNAYFIEKSTALTPAITASGANGLDTGTEANSTWYYVWVAQGSSGVCGLLSVSKSAPTLPTGYTVAKRLIGAVYNNSAGNLSVIYNYRNDRVTGWNCMVGDNSQSIADSFLVQVTFDFVPLIQCTYIGYAGSLPVKPADFTGHLSSQYLVMAYSYAPSTTGFTVGIDRVTGATLTNTYYFGFSFTAYGTWS